MHDDSPATLEREAFLRFSESATAQCFREPLPPEVARDIANVLVRHAIFSTNKATRDRATSDALVHGMTLFYAAVAAKWIDTAESERTSRSASGLPRKYVLGLDPLVHGAGMVAGYKAYLVEHLDRALEQALATAKATNGSRFSHGAAGRQA